VLRVLVAQLRDLVVQRIHAARRAQLLIVGAVAVAQLLQNPHVLLQPVHCYRAEACVLSQGPATLRAFFSWDCFTITPGRNQTECARAQSREGSESCTCSVLRNIDRVDCKHSSACCA